MSVSVISRPRGYVLGATEATGTISEYYSTLALVTTVNNHGLSTGDVVYIKSRASEYNGFWSIEVQTPKTFVLMLEDGSYLQYNVDASITYRVSTYDHAWSCAYLPIVYKLSNDRWPNNFVDTVRTFSSYANDNGYVRLTLSGSIGTFQPLDKLKINNAGDEDLDGVYTIIGSLSGSQVTIDLAYDSGYTFTGASVQLYKDNYNIVVKIHGGLDEHTLRSYNGSVLLSTLRLKPDSDNEVKFSVHEFIRSTVHIKNNLLLSALPNNTDAFTQFYIEYGESYDTSDGTIVSTQAPSFTSDSDEFVGYAASAKLPFKNVYSGYLSDYVMINNLSKFLTLFSIPVFFAGSCCDTCDECYTVDPIYIVDLSSWTQQPSGDVPWTLGSNPTVSLPGSGTLTERTSYRIKGAITNARPGKYKIVVSITKPGAVILTATLFNGVDIDSFQQGISGDIQNMVIDLDAGTETPTEFTLELSNISGIDNVFTITSVSIFQSRDVVEDSPCYQDLSFILDYAEPSIASIFTGIDIDQGAGNPDNPWTNNGPFNIQATVGADEFTDAWEFELFNPVPVPSTESAPDYVFDVTIQLINEGFFQGNILVVGTYSDPVPSLGGLRAVVTTESVIMPNVASQTIRVTTSDPSPGNSRIPKVVRVGVRDQSGMGNTFTITNISIVNNTSLSLVKDYGTIEEIQPIEYKGPGLYRVPLNLDNAFDEVDVSLVLNEATISETKTIEIDSKCGDIQIKMSWLNNLGGFEYWTFKAYTDHLVSIGETGTTSVNVIPSWPASYGEFADTEKRRETFRESTNQIVVRSQSLTQDQADAISYIKSSPLVQIFNTVYDKRTVIVDKDSFMVYRDNDKDFKIQFTITYTDDIPSQTV